MESLRKNLLPFAIQKSSNSRMTAASPRYIRPQLRRFSRASFYDQSRKIHSICSIKCLFVSPIKLIENFFLSFLSINNGKRVRWLQSRRGFRVPAQRKKMGFNRGSIKYTVNFMTFCKMALSLPSNLGLQVGTSIFEYPKPLMLNKAGMNPICKFRKNLDQGLYMFNYDVSNPI